MQSDQVLTPGRQPRSTAKLIAGIIGGVATLVGLVSGGIAIKEYLERDQGPAAFTEALDTSAGMRHFLDFAGEHDGQVVKLETQCVFKDGPMACAVEDDPLSRALVVLDLNDDAGCDPERSAPCDGSVLLYLFSEGSSQAQIDNGQFGAGSLVVKGYFTLSKRGALGTLPDGATAIYLTAVPPDRVPARG